MSYFKNKWIVFTCVVAFGYSYLTPKEMPLTQEFLGIIIISIMIALIEKLYNKLMKR